jgi:hypothetical protein
MITQKKPENVRLSMRKSVLVWVAGMFVGWGIAVVLVYQLISKTRMGEAGIAGDMIAIDHQAEALAKISPAAGGQGAAKPAPHAQSQQNAQAQKAAEMSQQTPKER